MRYQQHRNAILEPEQMARTRRAKLFSSVTNLKEVKFNKQSRAMAKLIPPRFSDHQSAWTDGSFLFILTEPYCDQYPPACDLAYIHVPVKLAPYGGGFSSSSTATPGTNSFLYTYCEDMFELRDIENALLQANCKAPAWNEV